MGRLSFYFSCVHCLMLKISRHRSFWMKNTIMPERKGNTVAMKQRQTTCFCAQTNVKLLLWLVSQVKAYRAIMQEVEHDFRTTEANGGNFVVVTWLLLQDTLWNWLSKIYWKFLKGYVGLWIESGTGKSVAKYLPGPLDTCCCLPSLFIHPLDIHCHRHILAFPSFTSPSSPPLLSPLVHPPAFSSPFPSVSLLQTNYTPAAVNCFYDRLLHP